MKRSFMPWMLAGCMLFSLACHRHGNDGSGGTNTAITADNSAPFVVKDSSEGLLFTWIDERGDFHVEQSAADVPLVGRDSVRVVDPTKEDGTHPDHIFVADLRTARPDGTYAVSVMTKAQFDDMALSRRKGKTATLADDGGTPPAPAADTDSKTASADPAPSVGRPAVIIYGAEWCGACHQAAAYLRSKGIPFIEKDIEADRNAAREMQGKLARAGLGSGSIPVLDVRGKVMVGFNPHVVDEALGAAL